jgi:hypothetical protein
MLSCLYCTHFLSVLQSVILPTEFTDWFGCVWVVGAGYRGKDAGEAAVSNTVMLIFIVVPCILISSKSFIHQQMHFVSVLENIKIYIKTSIKIAPTCFGVRPSSGALHMSLAKVKFMKSVKVRRYGPCGCVAACCC